MPSPRPSAGSPLRGRLRRGLQEGKSPRRNMLRGPSTSAAPATGPHLRSPSSPPPGFPAPACGLVAPPRPTIRHGPSASNLGCAGDGPSHPRPLATPTHTHVTRPRLPGGSRCHATPAQRHRQTPPLVKQPRLRRRRDRSSVTRRRWAIPTTVPARRPAGYPGARQTAALRQATAPPIGRHSALPPAPPNATITKPPSSCNDLRSVTGTRHASPATSSLVKNGAGPPVAIHSPASSRSLGSTS